MKAGDVVRFKRDKKKALSCYAFYDQIKGKQEFRIERIKASGGVILSGVHIGYNIEGIEQGFLQENFTVIHYLNK